MINVFLAFYLVKFVDEPTRGVACIDNLFNREEELTVSVKDEGIVDHKQIIASIPIDSVAIHLPSQTLKYRNFSKNNKIKMLSLVKSHSWEETFKAKQQMWKKLSMLSLVLLRTFSRSLSPWKLVKRKATSNVGSPRKLKRPEKIT